MQTIIDNAWENRASLSPANPPKDIADAVESVIADLNKGRKRVAEKVNGEWITHQWLKKAVLLSFRLKDNAMIHAGDLAFYDKVQNQVCAHEPRAGCGDWRARGAARSGPSWQLPCKNVVLMPSYVNIGAYVDEGTMVDTWANGWVLRRLAKNVHLSGGVGIGGVLEPIQANPTIIEDNRFIGARPR